MWYAKSESIDVWKSMMVNLQLRKALTRLKPLKKTFEELIIKKDHMDIFHYFENRLGKALNLISLLPSNMEAQKWDKMSFLVYLRQKFSVGGSFCNIFFSET